MTSLGLALLRLTLAVVFVAHGAHKLFGVWSGPGIGPGGLADTAKHFASIDLQPAFVLAALAGTAQLVGGLLIGVGALTRYASVAGLAYLGIGMWKAHWKWGLFLNWVNDPGRGQGIEYSLVLTGALACLLLAGPGDLSFDGRRASSRASRAAGRARLRGKV
jgi:putative oxidoreductase